MEVLAILTVIMQTPLPLTRALINLEAFRRNLDAVRSYIGRGPKILAVVKANAYGHGAGRLAEEAIRWGADYLGVARIHEGVDLRLGGITHPILVFEAAPADQLEVALRSDLELTLVSLDDARAMSSVARRLGMTASVHIKTDTGMGRLGFPHGEAAQAVERVAKLEGLRLQGIYSHFATSEETEVSYARFQLERFHGILKEITRRGIRVPLRHMANSGAIIALPDAHLDMVRPGIMLYGYTPGRGMAERFPVEPVMSLVSRVSFLKQVGPGESISYGRRYVTKNETTILTVPAGYADGYPRVLSGKAEALIGGRRYPIVGTICMDALMVDVGRESTIQLGDTVTLMGRQGEEEISAWDIAGGAGTIPYEVTCLIPPRVPRVYVERGFPA